MVLNVALPSVDFNQQACLKFYVYYTDISFREHNN